MDRQCVRCGAKPARGYASISKGSGPTQWACHGDDTPSPSCYELESDHFASLSPEQKTQVVTEMDRVYDVLCKQYDRDKEATQEGRRAALEGKGYLECPYPPGEGLEALTDAWRKGFQAGEIEQAEGAHFRTK